MAAEEGAEESRDSEDEVAVRDGGEQVPAQPLCPQQRVLLLARRAKGPSATRERHHIGRATGVAVGAAKAVFWHTAPDELPQDALDDRAQRAVLFGKALGVDAQELLDVLLDQTEER